MVKIQPGLYKHNKGQLYRVLAVARDILKDAEPRVVFQELVGEYETWSMPLREWEKRFTIHDVYKSGEIHVDKVGLLLIHNKKILMVRKKGDRVFILPSGTRRVAESDLVCLRRGVKEDYGFDVITDSAQHYGTFVAQAHGRIPGVLTKMVCYLAKCHGNPIKGGTYEYAWLDHSNRGQVATVSKIVFDELYYKGLIN